MFVVLFGRGALGVRNPRFLCIDRRLGEAVGLAGVIDAESGTILVTMVTAVVSLIVGVGIYYSSSQRSYLSYAWRSRGADPVRRVCIDWCASVLS